MKPEHSCRRAIARGLVVAAYLCAGLGLGAAGCDDSRRPDAAAAPAPATAPAAPAPAPAAANDAPAAAAAEAGVVRGSATTAGGKPIASFGGDVGGYNLASGKPVDANLDGANGKYKIRVGPGQISLRAWTDVEYNGRKYRIDLHPADGKPAKHKYDTTDGLVKDFVWRLDGYRPGHDERSGDVDATHGGTVDLNPEGHGVVYWRDIKDDRRHAAEPKVDADATVELTLTPDGPLIDGSEGKPVLLKIKGADIKDYMDRKRRGVPIGRYKATARAVAADGSARPLRVTAYTRAARKANAIPDPAASATLEFPQSAPPSHIVNRVDEVTVHVMY